ncbi:MAG: hypothetical protein GY928_10550 [Colwellia sp.]|nr:hypothetical protein [Colwellia sp.]
MTILKMIFWSFLFFNSFRSIPNIFDVFEIKYIRNHYILNSAMGAYYNILSIEGSDNGKLSEKIFSIENFFKFSTFFFLIFEFLILEFFKKF